MTTPKNHHQVGVFYALCAFVMWGFAPLYFKAVSFIAAPELLAHRILWSFVFIAALLVLWGGFAETRRVLQTPKLWLVLLATSALIGCNWLVFIWAINNDRLLDASLGYYINPLINVLLGMVFLGERLRRAQSLAVVIALIGVLISVVAFGDVPWVALTLAITFGLYGLLRKMLPVAALSGLWLETLTLLPLALLYLLWFGETDAGVIFYQDSTTNWLLLAAGPVTTIPLWFFTKAASRLSLSLLGFLQYIGPTLVFIQATWLFNEPLQQSQLWTFIFIWLALIIFSGEGLRQKQLKQAQS